MASRVISRLRNPYITRTIIPKLFTPSRLINPFPRHYLLSTRQKPLFPSFMPHGGHDAYFSNCTTVTRKDLGERFTKDPVQHFSIRPKKVQYYSKNFSVLTCSGISYGFFPFDMDFLAILFPTVLIHELGHLLAARLRGIAVSKFAIGFGPVLAKFNVNRIEYSLRAFPVGGYVQFSGAEGKFRRKDKRLYDNKSVWDRIFVALAGVAANVVFAYVLVLGKVLYEGLPGRYGTNVEVDAENLSDAIKYSRKVFLDVSSSVLNEWRNTFRSLVSKDGIKYIDNFISKGGIDILPRDGFINSCILLNLNMVVFNLIPFPPLDGGLLAVLFLEVVRGGKKLPPKLDQKIFKYGAIALFSYLAYRNLDFIKELLLEIE